MLTRIRPNVEQGRRVTLPSLGHMSHISPTSRVAQTGVDCIRLRSGAKAITEARRYELSLDAIFERLGLSGPKVVHDWRYRHEDFPEPVHWVGRAMVGRKRMRLWSCERHVDGLEGIQVFGSS